MTAITEREQLLVDALITARHFQNQTMLNKSEVEAWHLKVDALIAETTGDPDPTQRFDDPKRAEQRAFVERLFSRSLQTI